MKVAILTSGVNHPVYTHLVDWKKTHEGVHDVQLVTSTDSLDGGDLLFLVSCHQIVRQEHRAKYRSTLVIHASALPQGRGWSPLEWQILEGRHEIAVSLLEATDRVDAGDIWARGTLRFEGHELVEEIRSALYAVECELMDFAMLHLNDIKPAAQNESEATYYRRRTPADSRLDPSKSIGEQFDLLRIADGARFPAFFDLRGHRYVVRVDKCENAPEQE